MAALKKAKKTKPIKLYSLTMSGQGDTQVTLVTKEIWDWVMSPLGRPVPQDVIDYHYEYDDPDDDPGWEPIIAETNGKPNGCTVNDAALNAPGAKVAGERATFIRMSDFSKFVRKHNIDIVEEWDGYIY